jgi:hypothetical protein
MKRMNCSPVSQINGRWHEREPQLLKNIKDLVEINLRMGSHQF